MSRRSAGQMTPCERLNSLIHRSGMTQVELAAKIGTTKQNIGNYLKKPKYAERGDFYTYELVSQLAKVLVGRGSPPIAEEEVWRLHSDTASIRGVMSSAIRAVNPAPRPSTTGGTGLRVYYRAEPGVYRDPATIRALRGICCIAANADYPAGVQFAAAVVDPDGAVRSWLHCVEADPAPPLAGSRRLVAMPHHSGGALAEVVAVAADDAREAKTLGFILGMYALG